MKNFKILLLGLLVAFFSVSSANAQTMQDKFDVYTCIYFDCDGMYNLACGEMVFHELYHFNNDGYVDWFKLQVKAKDLESLTGEKFKLSYKYNEDAWIPGEVIDWFVHFTLVGDMGTKVIYSQKWRIDTATWEWTLIHEMSKCI
jgi:hypothetical protein